MLKWLHVFLDNWSPWHLRSSKLAIKKEADSLCAALQNTQYENVELKRSLREAMKKMYMPLRGVLKTPISGSYFNQPFQQEVLWFDLHPQTFSVVISKDFAIGYREGLIEYMAEYTSEQMIEAIKKYVEEKVCDFYKRKLLSNE